VASIARGRRWLDELIADPTASADSIAWQEQCSVRKVNMTISLAFLAPDLVKAAIDGRLPMAWALLASPTCQPNGPSRTRCSVFLGNNRIHTLIESPSIVVSCEETEFLQQRQRR
jgi:hypothetical protein